MPIYHRHWDDEYGLHYFFNEKTGESTWTVPGGPETFIVPHPEEDPVEHAPLPTPAIEIKKTENLLQPDAPVRSPTSTASLRLRPLPTAASMQGVIASSRPEQSQEEHGPLVSKATMNEAGGEAETLQALYAFDPTIGIRSFPKSPKSPKSPVSTTGTGTTSASGATWSPDAGQGLPTHPFLQRLSRMAPLSVPLPGSSSPLQAAADALGADKGNTEVDGVGAVLGPRTKDDVANSAGPGQYNHSPNMLLGQMRAQDVLAGLLGPEWVKGAHARARLLESSASPWGPGARKEAPVEGGQSEGHGQVRAASVLEHVSTRELLEVVRYSALPLPPAGLGDKACAVPWEGLGRHERGEAVGPSQTGRGAGVGNAPIIATPEVKALEWKGPVRSPVSGGMQVRPLSPTGIPATALGSPASPSPSASNALLATGGNSFSRFDNSKQQQQQQQQQQKRRQADSERSLVQGQKQSTQGATLSTSAAGGGSAKTVYGSALQGQGYASGNSTGASSAASLMRGLDGALARLEQRTQTQAPVQVQVRAGLRAGHTSGGSTGGPMRPTTPPLPGVGVVEAHAAIAGFGDNAPVGTHDANVSVGPRSSTPPRPQSFEGKGAQGQPTSHWHHSSASGTSASLQHPAASAGGSRAAAGASAKSRSATSAALEAYKSRGMSSVDRAALAAVMMASTSMEELMAHLDT